MNRGADHGFAGRRGWAAGSAAGPLTEALTRAPLFPVDSVTASRVGGVAGGEPDVHSRSVRERDGCSSHPILRRRGVGGVTKQDSNPHEVL